MAFVRSILQVVFFCLLFSSYDMGVEGDRRFLSEEENIELEKQLKLLNKPSIKTIVTKHGDIYDCVDFYKQPAFDHPLLKNHTFHPRMRPSSIPRLTTGEEFYKVKSSSNKSRSVFGRVDCPFGTVPIRRIIKDDLIREKLHAKIYDYKYSILNGENPGTHYAVVRTKFDPPKKYYGAGINSALYNPLVLQSQYSSSRMKIQNGVENIQVGWTVNPILYGDNKLRYYISYNGAQSVCFNTRCPGFVIVDNSFPIDSVLDTNPDPNIISNMESTIFKDAPISNWWLSIYRARNIIGFWPARLFTNLVDSGSNVDWGGEVFSPPDVPSPPMGRGILPSRLRIINGVNQRLTTVNEANQIVDAVDTEEYKDVDNYGVIDIKDSSGLDRHGMFYGGPGGAKQV